VIDAAARFVVLVTVGTLASTQLAVAASASGPGVEGAVQLLQMMVVVAGMSLMGKVGAVAQLPATFIDAPVTFATAAPVLVSVRVMLKVCPVLSVAGVVVMLVAVTSAAATTGTAAVAGPAVWLTPVLPSRQVADPPRVKVCGVAGAVHPDQVRLSVAPMPLTGVDGAVVQVVPVSDTAVTSAAAVPALLSVNVTVKSWPAVSAAGVVVRLVAVTTAGVCTTTVVLAVFDVTASEASFPSVPDAEAERVTVPAVPTVQLA
jgi:hypothetical protein